jgi:signal transduction histidine kinase
MADRNRFLKPPQPENFAQLVPLWLAAYAVEVVGSLAFRHLAPYDLRFTQILIATSLQLTGLALVHRWAVRSPRWALGFLIWESLCQAAILHAMGPLRIAVAPAVWTFILVLPGLRLSRFAHYALANYFAALYIAIVLVEIRFGLESMSPHITIDPSLSLRLSFVVLLILNVAALFVFEAKRLRDHRATDLERQKRQIAADLWRTQASTNRLLRIMSHDVQGELGFLTSVATELRDANPALGPEQRARYLTFITTSCEKIRGLLQRILAGLRAEFHADPEWLDLREVVHDVLDVLEAQLSAKSIRVSVGALPRVWGQKLQIGHVLLNLFSNAVKYVPIESGSIDVFGTADPSEVRFGVRDNGCGMSTAERDRVLAVASCRPGRADHEQESSESPTGGGIGLRLVNEIVRSHGGTFSIESEPGMGTTVLITLPTPSSPADPPEPSALLPPAGAAGEGRPHEHSHPDR